MRTTTKYYKTKQGILISLGGSPIYYYYKKVKIGRKTRLFYSAFHHKPSPWQEFTEVKTKRGMLKNIKNKKKTGDIIEVPEPEMALIFGCL